MKALLLENIHPDGRELLAARGVDVDARDEALGEDALIEALDGVSLLGIRSATHVTEAVVRARPHLLAVGAYCIGTNQIDLNAAGEAGIAVFNAPSASSATATSARSSRCWPRAWE